MEEERWRRKDGGERENNASFHIISPSHTHANDVIISDHTTRKTLAIQGSHRSTHRHTYVLTNTYTCMLALTCTSTFT